MLILQVIVSCMGIRIWFTRLQIKYENLLWGTIVVHLYVLLESVCS